MSINPIKIANSPAAYKRVAFLSFDGLSDPLGQSQILPYLRGLAKEGFQISIFSCEKPDRLEKEAPQLKQQLAAAGIAWHFLNYDEAGNWRSRWRYADQLFAMVKNEHENNPFDLLHCRSYLAALSGKKMWQRFKIPFLFDMRGFWADERIDGGIWKKSKPLHALLYRYFKFQERQLLKSAAAVISLTQAGLTELCRLYPNLQLQNKTTIIPCCTDTGLFDPKKVTATVLPEIPDTAHLLVYTGSIGTWYLTKEMIDCALVWRQHIPKLQLLILTRDHEQVKAITKNLSLPENFLITASASHSDVPAYLKKAKAAIYFIKPAYSKIASSPTKMAECWSMGLPIITNTGIGDGDALFRTHKGGILVSQFTETAYAEACEAYQKEQFDRDALRDIAVRFFDHRSAVQLYQKAYQNILSSSV